MRGEKEESFRHRTSGDRDGDTTRLQSTLRALRSEGTSPQRRNLLGRVNLLEMDGGAHSVEHFGSELPKVVHDVRVLRQVDNDFVGRVAANYAGTTGKNIATAQSLRHEIPPSLMIPNALSKAWLVRRMLLREMPEVNRNDRRNLRRPAGIRVLTRRSPE